MGKQEVENCQALEKVPFLIDCVGGVCAVKLKMSLFIYLCIFLALGPALDSKSAGSLDERTGPGSPALK